MQGDIVKAAKWLAGGMVAAALVCVVGFHPMVTGRVVSVQKVGEPQMRDLVNDSFRSGPPTPERIHGGVMQLPTYPQHFPPDPQFPLACEIADVSPAVGK